MSESEKMWLEDAARNGWVMPRASWWKRLWGIRHVRYIHHSIQAQKFRNMTAAMGLGIGGVPQFDRWVLYGILTGKERRK